MHRGDEPARRQSEKRGKQGHAVFALGNCAERLDRDLPVLVEPHWLRKALERPRGADGPDRVRKR